MKTTHTIAILLTSFLLTGCVGVVPLPHKTNARLEAGHEFTRSDTSFIVRQQTTQADVISQMGKQYYELGRYSAIAYTWQYQARQYLWWWTDLWWWTFDPATQRHNGDAGLIESGNWHGVFIAFAADGSVIDFEFRHLSCRKSLDTQLEKWATSRGAYSKLHIDKS